MQKYMFPWIRDKFFEDFNAVKLRQSKESGEDVNPAGGGSNKLAIRNIMTTGEGGPAEFLQQRGEELLFEECDFDSAKVLFQQCYDYLCKALSPHHNETLAASCRLADTMRELGDYDGAAELYQQCVKEYVENAGSKVGLAIATAGWAEAALALGNFTLAKQKFADALANLKNVQQLGIVDHVDTFQAEIGLIKVLEEDCKYVEAVRLLDRMLKKVKGEYGPHHKYFAEVALMHARCKRGKGTFSDVKLSFDQTFIARRQLYAEDHLYFGYAVFESAEYDYCMGRFEDAMAKYTNVLDICLNYIGEEHPFTLKVRTCIVEVKFALGFVQDSLQEHEELLRLNIQILGSSHRSVGDALYFKGRVLSALGKHTQAEESFTEANGIYVTAYGESHSKIASLKFALADNCKMQGNFDRSKELHNSVLKLRRDIYGKDHPLTVASQIATQLFVIFDESDLATLDEKVQKLEKLQKSQKAFYGDDHPTFLATLVDLGDLYAMYNRHPEAISKYEEAIKLCEVLYGGNHYSIPELNAKIIMIRVLNVETEREARAKAKREAQEATEREVLKDASTGEASAASEKLPDEAVDMTPVYDNEEYQKYISLLNEAIESISKTFPITSDYVHPSIINFRGNIGIVEKIEEDGRREFLMRLTRKEKALYKEAAERKLSEQFANNTADFSDSSPGSERLQASLSFLKSHSYGKNHPWIKKFTAVLESINTEKVEGTEPGNVSVLKATKKLQEAHDNLVRGEHDVARDLYKETLERLPECASRPEDPAIYAMAGECLCGLADIYRFQCMMKEAREHYIKSLRVLRKIENNENNEKYVWALLGFSDLLFMEGHFEECESYIEEALTIKQKFHDSYSQDVIDIEYRKVFLDLKMGRYSEGLEACRTILDRRLRLVSEISDVELKMKIAHTYNAIAEFYILLAKYPDADHYVSVAIKTSREVIAEDKDHMTIAESYHLRGELRMAQGKNKEALRNFGHSLAMKMRLLIVLKKKSEYDHLISDDGKIPKDIPIDPASFLHTTIAISLYGQAESLRRDGKVQLASELFAKSTQIVSELFGEEDNPITAAVWFAQAENFRLFGKYDMAEDLYTKSLEMKNRLYPAKHPDKATAMIGKGCLLADQCRLEEAFVYFEIALELCMQYYGDSHPLTAYALVHSADIDRKMGRYVEAEAQYHKAIAILKPLFGETHALICPALHGLAENCHAQEKFKDADVLFSLITSVVALEYGEGHPDVATFSVGHSRTLIVQGRFSEAKVASQRALNIFNKVFGAEHASTITALLSVARSLQCAGRYEKALPYFQRALVYIKKIFKPGLRPHLIASECHMDNAECLRCLGRYKEAIDHFESAIEIRRAILGSNHVLTVYALSGKAESVRLLGDLRKAEEWHNQTLEIAKQLSGGTVTLLSSLAMARLADTIVHLGMYDQAKSFYERVLQTRLKILGGRHPLIADTFCSLGHVCLKRDEYSEARVYFDKGLELYKMLHRENHPSIAHAMYGVAECVRLMGFHYDAEESYFEAIHLLAGEMDMEYPAIVRMMFGFAQNRLALGKVYPFEDGQLPNVEPDSPVIAVDHPFTVESVDVLWAFPILFKAVKLLEDAYSDSHYDVLEGKSILVDMYIFMGLLDKALLLQKELLSAYKIHFRKDYIYMAPVLYKLAEIESRLGKIAPRPKVFELKGKPDLSATAITSGPEAKKKQSTKVILPKIGPIEQKKRTAKRKVYGYMGCEFAPVKTRDIDPSSPADHLILNEIENALRDMHKKPPGASHIVFNDDPANSMINDSARLFDIAHALHSERFHDDYMSNAFTATIFHGKADLMRHRHEFEEASKLYKNALQIRYKSLRSGHPLIAQTLFGLAENYRMMSKVKEAMPLYQQSLVIRQEAYGEKELKYDEHVSIAESKWGISLALFDQGLYLDAVEPCEYSLIVRRYWMGTENIVTVSSELSLANILSALYEHEKAKALYEHALNVGRRVFGDSHVHVVAIKNNYAHSLKSQGFLDEAKELYEGILKVQEALYGSHHPDIASSFNNIGSVYFSKGMYEEALPYYRKAVEMKRACFGNENAVVASSLHNLGGVLFSLQRYEEAKDNYEEALLIRSTLFNYFHPCIADTLNNIGILLFSMKQFEESESVYNRSLDIKEQVYGKNHVAYAATLHNVAVLLHYLERTGEARDAYSKCLEIQEEKLGPDHPDTVATRSGLHALDAELPQRESEDDRMRRIEMESNDNAFHS